ncbi:hypothetical protein [Eubacterium oxidoreducens]|nr:hypothetical protein [Eubacterium oxidoreducens]
MEQLTFDFFKHQNEETYFRLKNTLQDEYNVNKLHWEVRRSILKNMKKVSTERIEKLVEIIYDKRSTKEEVDDAKVELFCAFFPLYETTAKKLGLFDESLIYGDFFSECYIYSFEHALEKFTRKKGAFPSYLKITVSRTAPKLVRKLKSEDLAHSAQVERIINVYHNMCDEDNLFANYPIELQAMQLRERLNIKVKPSLKICREVVEGELRQSFVFLDAPNQDNTGTNQDILSSNASLQVASAEDECLGSEEAELKQLQEEILSLLSTTQTKKVINVIFRMLKNGTLPSTKQATMNRVQNRLNYTDEQIDDSWHEMQTTYILLKCTGEVNGW